MSTCSSFLTRETNFLVAGRMIISNNTLAETWHRLIVRMVLKPMDENMIGIKIRESAHSPTIDEMMARSAKYLP